MELKFGNHYAFNMHHSTLIQIFRLVFIFISVAAATSNMAETRLVRDEEGISVSELVDQSRTLPVLIATTLIHATPNQVAEWIGAVHTYTRWQYNCVEAYTIPQPDKSLRIYNRVASPWPVADRDVVLQSNVTMHPDDSITIEFFNVDDATVKLSAGVVRMPYLAGKYELSPTSGNTHVVYTIDSDPGGKLPAWLVRRASKELPYFTLKKLRDLVESGPPPEK